MKLSSVLLQLGFIQSKEDECLFIKKDNAGDIYLLTYVDDMLLMTNNLDEALAIEEELQSVFDITALGNVSSFLGIKVTRQANGNFELSQEAYIRKMLLNFDMENAKPSKIPLDPGYLKEEDKSPILSSNDHYQSLIGALLYLAVHTRPDIVAATSILSRKISHPTQRDMNEAKRILRYLQNTKTVCLVLGHQATRPVLECYVDADWAGDRSDCKSNSGFITFYHGSPIDWCCRKQNCVALSSTEAEFISISEACKQIIPIKRLMQELEIISTEPIIIKEDNQGAMKLVQNEKFGKRSKHIDTRYYFIKDLYLSNVVTFEYCPTEDMIADIFTKPLSAVKLMKFRSQVGLCEPSNAYKLEEEC